MHYFTEKASQTEERAAACNKKWFAFMTHAMHSLCDKKKAFKIITYMTTCLFTYTTAGLNLSGGDQNHTAKQSKMGRKTLHGPSSNGMKGAVWNQFSSSRLKPDG